VNRELKRVSVVVLLMFVALFTSTSIIQVVRADDLTGDPRNTRTLLSSFSAQRGSILVDGTPIVRSERVDDDYKYLRVYEQPKLYAPITGYFTLGQGTTGVESALNDYLSGTANEQFLDQVSSLLSGQDPKGASVELTIDPEVQQTAWEALDGKTGAIVAIKPKTGEVLAMVSRPSYDPNELAVHDRDRVLDAYNTLVEAEDDPLINRAISGDLYYPGSTFKLVVGTAALESGQYTVDSKFPNPTSLTLPQSSTTITNSGGGACGGGKNVTIATAIILSCNIPMAELGRDLGQDAIGAKAADFGFGKELSIPMEVTPSTYPTGMDDAQTMLSSFGQFDDRVTPLQVAMVSAAIANDGQLMQPTLIERIIAPDLTTVEDAEPTVFSTPMSTETADALTAVMVQGVSAGAASNARIEGVDVAGKTGTAQNGGDLPYTLWFTGFAPANDPEVAIAVVLEDGGGMGQSGFGNGLAAPIAKQVLEAVLNK
jgi:peptidoglycan glycosyltransferase